MNQSKLALVEIHTAVFLFGLSGMLGQMITLSPLVIVCGRTLFASFALLILLKISKTTIRIHSVRDLTMLVVIGVILAIHWFCFFQSIKVSSVAIGLITFSTFPLFVTFMEPYFFKERLTVSNIIIAVSVFLGIFLVIPSFDLNNRTTLGVVWGVASGFTFAVLSLLNRRYVNSYQSTIIAFYQNTVAALVLLPMVLITDIEPQVVDYILLPFLGIFCTAAAHTLFIKSLRIIKAQLASLISCLEPVYGILLALVLLGEYPTIRTWLGGVIILGTISMATFRRS